MCIRHSVLSLPGLKRLWPQATKVMIPTAGAGSDEHLLGVVQLLAPALVGRAKVFGNTLVLQADMVCEDMPYFDGPVLGVAPHGPEPCLPTDLLAVRGCVPCHFQ